MFKSYNIPTIVKAMKIMGKKNKMFIASILGFCAVEIMGSILYTIGIKGLLNALSQQSTALFRQSFIFAAASHVSWWIYAPFSSYMCSFCSKGAIRDYKTNLCGHIIALPMTYHDKKSTGELLSSVSNDAACLQTIYDWSFFAILESGIVGFSAIIIMIAVDWRFASAVLVLGIFSVYITTYFSKKLEANGKNLQEKLAQSSTDAYELVKAAKTIRLFNLSAQKFYVFEKDTRLEADIKVSGGKISAKMNALILGISSLMYAAILAVGAVFVYLDLTDWGTVVAITGLKYASDMLFSEFGQRMAGMQTNIAGVKRLFEIMDTPAEKIHNETSYIIQNQTAPAALNNVTFSYDETVPILEQFNLTVENRRFTALTGESGAGKSTVMKLILGLYEPDSGNISFNGTESSSLDSIRSKTAYVPQEAMLFRGSVYENIACGNPLASKDDVEKAASLAGADKFIKEFENGFDTVILDDGKSLSGGQKQRIAIARALVKNADILLLDEITSALDRGTEKSILQTIKEISKTKTVLLITHKADIIDIADSVRGL